MGAGPLAPFVSLRVALEQLLERAKVLARSLIAQAASRHKTASVFLFEALGAVRCVALSLVPGIPRFLRIRVFAFAPAGQSSGALVVCGVCGLRSVRV